jgi:hypothetical protein
VEARLKADMRPIDGVPAANLASWLEGIGWEPEYSSAEAATFWAD